MLDLRALRAKYPITREGIFLNHAATSPVSTATLNRLKAAVDEMAEPLGKHIYRTIGVMEDTRRRLAELIGAHPSEIAFSSNTSTSLSLIASAVRFAPGDRVLVPDNEFPSNIFAWQNLKAKGVECELFTVEAGVPLVETLKKLNLDRVRLISISAVSFETGRLYELEEFTRFCRERGILSCIDAIQAIGAIPVDVKKIGTDFLASGAQKWLLGPVGCGILYARPELLDQLEVPYVGWTSVKYPENFSLKVLDFATEMTRFEPGLPNILPIVGLNESLRELTEVGWENIYANIRAHVEYLQGGLRDRGARLLLADSDGTAGIVSFYLPDGSDSRRTHEVFANKGISVTVRENYVRVSPHFYTEKAELDGLLDSLSAVTSDRRIIRTGPVTENHTKPTARGRMLLSGASGILGEQLGIQLAQRGYDLTLLGRDRVVLEDRAKSLRDRYGIQASSLTVDYTDEKSFSECLDRMEAAGEKFVGVVNAAGLVKADPFVELTDEALKAMVEVNLFAPARITRAFLRRLRAKDSVGVLNIIPGSARCGFPLLSGFGASYGALWTLGEALDREVRKDGLHVTNFIAGPMHSRMQKQIGRTALRYFKTGGAFDYDHPDQVAKAAVDAFLVGKSVAISSRNRLQNVINSVLPSVIERRLAKVWKV